MLWYNAELVSDWTHQIRDNDIPTVILWVKWSHVDLKYRALIIAAKAVSFLPMRVGYFLAGCGGDALFLLSARHRYIVGDNIKHILGMELDKRRLRRKVRIVFKNLAKNYFDLTKLPQLRSGNLDRSVSIEGWHHLTKAFK